MLPSEYLLREYNNTTMRNLETKRERETEKYAKIDRDKMKKIKLKKKRTGN
jgi:hypothetical protein